MTNKQLFLRFQCRFVRTRTLLCFNIWESYVTLFCSFVEIHTFQNSRVLDSYDMLAFRNLDILLSPINYKFDVPY